MARRDVVAAAAMLLFAAAATVESARLLPYGVVRNPGPGFFPWWLALTLGTLSLTRLVHSLLPGRAGHEGAGGQVGKVVALLAVLGVYALVLDLIGYPIATFLLVLFMLRVTERHRWPLALGLALLAAGGSYVVFAVWLSVPLPAGPFAR
ncbi:MAG: tripartite tricarboxylate transporter TctB family protein [Candidatus Rokubacteria bacterium]|nr:tripartite tricarboxylate transporter TctB family protein [Candidatus Rokubacteria bacterium]